MEISTSSVLPVGVAFDFPTTVDESDQFVAEFIFTEEAGSQLAHSADAASDSLLFTFKVVA